MGTIRVEGELIFPDSLTPKARKDSLSLVFRLCRLGTVHWLWACLCRAQGARNLLELC